MAGWRAIIPLYVFACSAQPNSSTHHAFWPKSPQRAVPGECGPSDGFICGWGQPCCSPEGICGSTEADFCNSNCLSEYSFGGTCTQDVTFAPTVSTECPAGWAEFNGYCWSITSSNHRWARCDAQCSPGWLACILNQAENEFVADLTYSQQASTVWLGASDAATEGVWEWTSSCPHSSSFTAWSPNEPSNSGNGGEQHCAAMWNQFYGGMSLSSVALCPQLAPQAGTIRAVRHSERSASASWKSQSRQHQAQNVALMSALSAAGANPVAVQTASVAPRHNFAMQTACHSIVSVAPARRM